MMFLVSFETHGLFCFVLFFFLLFCGFFVMTTHKIEVQVMISVKLDHCYFQLDFGPCRVNRSS